MSLLDQPEILKKWSPVRQVRKVILGSFRSPTPRQHGVLEKSKIQTQPTTANEPNDQEQKTERQKTYTLTINQQRRREYNILSILLLLE
jgi:hypothetical protein